MNTTRKSIEAGTLKSFNNSDADVSVADFSKYAFRYYTTQKTLANILGASNKPSYFYVSNLSEMNDKDEATIHNGYEKTVHALCFSNTDSESIPMWYLYSGLLGKGACIRLTAGLMTDYLKSIDTVYPVKEDMSVDTSNPLRISDNFDMRFGWVYYYDNGKDIWYRNNWYKISDNIDSFFDDNYFLKKYPWNYEKEFRIVFINKTETQYKRIAVPLPNRIIKSRNLSIILAPESDLKDVAGLSESDYIVKKSQMDISMNLLTRNKDDIYDYLSKAVECYEKELKSKHKALL